jgi:hypothetical protein
MNFANARIGLNERGSRTHYSYGVVTSHGRPSAKAVFGKGFKLIRLDGCHLNLRNEAVSLLWYCQVKCVDVIRRPMRPTQ